ncbi:putative mRNA (guanine-N(7)-)-methyltransferase [Rosa chinensis]|uniref:mRNA guanylyltransferase n=1 Tax=Rosa chinensis TaxID=74649 RepID=A0A2P6R9D5_ROSCH|nr:mRNA-capping enzyme [Rosa chinensis]PRQ43021.1 putative mRNA (guanine-N(7)-)-methyltransferase [Rosa chinensis]
MIVAMDLNASPLPEDDEETFEEYNAKDYSAQDYSAQEYSAPQEHVESGVDILRREREERRKRLKRDRPDDRPVPASQPPAYESYQAKFAKVDTSRLPSGWLDCPSSGQEIYCMIPSKVPLCESYNDCVPPGRRYSFKQVIHQQRVLGRKLGLVIDLTNTTRYYQTTDLKKEGIKHIKIPCKGRDSVPDNPSVNQFVYEVMQFMTRQKHTKKYILVHCTHGHNRTGYMIIHYLMRTLPISVTQAIKTFADARPPGIYKPDYIDALYSFYHERKPEMVVCPSTPEWKRSSEFDLNGEAVADDDDDGGPAAPSHENQETDGVMTNDDILGDEIPRDQQEAMRQFCYQSLKLPPGKRGNAQFPGSHPVSLSRDNLQLLRQRYYYATWKADGTRYMMLITMDGCFLIDRSFNFRRVQMRFPCKHTNDVSADKVHHFTLLDGEMVIDTVPDSQKQERRYLIYDMMAINHVSLIERPFYERWKMLEKEVIEPRNHERHNIYQSRNPYYRYDLEPFRVRRKDFWLLSTVTKLLKEFIPKLSHEADGLIFQGWDDPYVPRTHEGLLKWKYPEMNSVDFLFEVGEDDRQLLFLYEHGKKKLMEGNRVAFKDGSDSSFYSGKIVECSWDMEANVWVCMRVRVDKSTPNDFNTYRKVMKSIKDNITQDVLLDEIYEIIRLPMYADRIRNDSKAAQQHLARRR